MTTDDFTKAAHAEGQARIAAMLEAAGASDDIRAWFPAGFEKGAEWARTHLAAQEPTDAEVLAALNAHGVVMSPKMHPAPSLDYWGDKSAEAMRAALSAARAARRDEATR